MKVGVRVCMDVDAYLSRLNAGLRECYGRYTSSQVRMYVHVCMLHNKVKFNCAEKSLMQ